MNKPSEFILKRVNWEDAGDVLRAIRRTVFVDEQGVPEALEWDGLDGRCIHVMATDADGAVIGTGRLLPDGHIGRMAVVRHWRNRGVGGGILKELIAAAADAGHASAVLNAQTHAVGFYTRFGFEVVGDEFIEAGIPHRAMRLELVTLKPR